MGRVQRTSCVPVSSPQVWLNAVKPELDELMKCAPFAKADVEMRQNTTNETTMKSKLNSITALLLLAGSVIAVVTMSCSVQAVDIWGRGEVPRITDPKDVPQTIPEIWKDYNENYDRNNPLEAVVHKTWETKDGIVVNWVQMTVGTFQGRKSVVCGYWAYPKGAKQV